MWHGLTFWGALALALGFFALGANRMSTDQLFAKTCFTISAIILLARFGWWLAFELHTNTPRLVLCVFILFGIIGSLWLISMKWVAQREQKSVMPLQKQLTAEEIATEVAKRIPGLTLESKESQPQEPAKKVDKTEKSILPEPPPKELDVPLSPSPPPIVMQLPSVGNLKQRAITLSEEIMEDLYRHGWRQYPGRKQESSRMPIQQMPTDSEGVMKWTRSRSGYFKFRFFERVLDLRNEFAQLHLRDQELDDFFKYQGMIENANRQLSALPQPQRIDHPILPQEIERVAERLKILADQIKSD